MTLPNYKNNGADFRGYYYDQYGLTQQNLSDFMATIWNYTGPKTPDAPDTDGAVSDTSNNTITLDAINDPASIYNIDFAGVLERSAISLAILDDDTLGHAITLWGVEYGENGNLTTLWLTDSDDYAHQLFSVAVTLDDKENKIYLGKKNADGKYICDAYEGYENIFIGGIYAIDTNVAAQWQLVPEPTTASLSLMALAALAARRRRHSGALRGSQRQQQLQPHGAAPPCARSGGGGTAIASLEPKGGASHPAVPRHSLQSRLGG
jgi:MYXO-CTERM domain-containing protein